MNALLHEIQRDLFALGAQLADPKATVGASKAKAALPPAEVEGSSAPSTSGRRACRP